MRSQIDPYLSARYKDAIPGTLLFNKYRVIKKIGVGTTSVVYACSHPLNADQTVALKVLKPEISSDLKLLQRFRNEIHASYRISHTNVVRSYEFIREPNVEAFSMEYIEGGTLDDVIKQKPVQSIDEAVRILFQVLEGIAALHHAGIIHRDIKPQNILMTENGTVKISDFNTVIFSDRLKQEEDLGQIGTVEYMSPEVLSSGRADERSDIYAVGVLAYQLIAGVIPFKSNSFRRMIRRKLRSKPVALRRMRLDCSKELSNFVMKALSRDPRHRFSSADEMKAELVKLELSTRKRPWFFGLFRAKSSAFVTPAFSGSVRLGN